MAARDGATMTDPAQTRDAQGRFAQSEACPKGHPYVEGNVSLDPRGWPTCRQCARERRRRYHERHREREQQRERERGRRRNGTVEQRARNALGTALRWGNLAKAERCEGCGDNGPLHGHHEDYAKPLEVVWLCVPCHVRCHRPHEHFAPEGRL